MSTINYKEAVLNEDGTLKNFTLTVAGKDFHCPTHDCGCNCFHKPYKDDLSKYRCNGCGTTFRAK